jgi:hypothetical protein
MLNSFNFTFRIYEYERAGYRSGDSLVFESSRKYRLTTEIFVAFRSFSRRMSS